MSALYFAGASLFGAILFKDVEPYLSVALLTASVMLAGFYVGKHL